MNKVKQEILKEFDKIMNSPAIDTCPYCGYKGRYSQPTIGVQVHIRRTHPNLDSQSRKDKVRVLILNSLDKYADYVEEILLERKTVEELLPMIPESFGVDIGLHVAYKEGFNKAIDLMRDKKGKILG